MFLKILTYTTIIILLKNASSEADDVIKPSFLSIFPSQEDTEIENIRKVLFGDGICKRSQYRCVNDKCISRDLFCDSQNDCGDNSDESYCSILNRCPEKLKYFSCSTTSRYFPRKCIPVTWKCDGVKDCFDNADEIGCDGKNDQKLRAHDVVKAASLSKNWIIKGRKAERKLQKWGLDLPRKAVALYMFSTATDDNNTFIDEMAYELSSNFLSKIALNKNNVSTADIASYVNAFLTTCIDPRQFYALDLVKELRTRMDNINGSNPFALLTLCNAQELITARDVQKLKERFWIAQEKYRIDIMAMIVLALSCAFTQSENVVDQVLLSNFVLELKKLQHRNGTIENVKSTALVMQALFASEREPDEDNFDEKKAIMQILRSQDADGSFGNLANTYYAVPVLNGLSLVNISSKHCSQFIRDENEGLQNLQDQFVEKQSVKYSLWIHGDKFIQRTLAIRVPRNTSFYGIMEYASDLDVNFRFKYNVRNRKPFVYSLYRFMDDPEKEMFWSLNQLINETSGEIKAINKSPADVYPRDKDHLVYWYKSES